MVMLWDKTGPRLRKRFNWTLLWEILGFLALLALMYAPFLFATALPG